MRYRQWKKNYKKNYGRNPSIIMDKRMQRKAKAHWKRTLPAYSAQFCEACLRLSVASYRTASAIGAFFGKAQDSLINKY